MNPIDLKQCHEEVRRWFAGMRVYSEFTTAVYPLASHIILRPLLGWLGLWTQLHRRVDPWLLLGVAAPVAGFCTYHRLYGDVLVLLPMVPLFHVAKRLFRSFREARRDGPPRRRRPPTVRCRRYSVPPVESLGQRQAARIGSLTGFPELPGGPIHEKSGRARQAGQIRGLGRRAGGALAGGDGGPHARAGTPAGRSAALAPGIHGRASGRLDCGACTPPPVGALGDKRARWNGSPDRRIEGTAGVHPIPELVPREAALAAARAPWCRRKASRCG